MAGLINSMDNSEDREKVLKEINSKLWLHSMGKRMAIFTEYLGLEYPVESTTNDTCDHLTQLANDDELILLHKWIFSQGGSPEEPPVPLGELLQPNFAFMTWNGDGPQNFFLATLAMLSPGPKDPPLPTVQRYFRNDQYGYGSDIEVEEIMSVSKPWKCDGALMKSYFGGRNQQMFCNSSHQDLSGKCCLLEQFLQQNYRLVLSQMKYSISPITWQVEEKGDMEDVLNMLPIDDFPVVPNLESTILNYYPTVFASQDANEPSKQASQLFRTFSTNGISQSYNIKDFRSIYKDHNLLKIFYEEIVAKTESIPEDSLARTLHPKGNGPSFSFEAFIKVDSSKGVALTVHGSSELPDTRGKPIMILPGNSYDIIVKPSLTTVDATVIDMDVEDRNCLTNLDPHNLTLFKNYTFGACRFECQLRLGLQKCGCIPWDYPSPTAKNESFPICHKAAGICFEKVLSEGLSKDESCYCPDDCNSVQVTIFWKYGNKAKYYFVSIHIFKNYYSMTIQSPLTPPCLVRYVHVQLVIKESPPGTDWPQKEGFTMTTSSIPRIFLRLGATAS